MKRFLFVFASSFIFLQCTEDEKLEFTNPEGKLAKREIFTSPDAEKPEQYVVYQYDQHANLVEHTVYDYPDFKWALVQYTYDDKQRLHIEKPFVIRNGVPSSNGHLEYLYDDQDRVIKVRSYANGQISGDESSLFYDLNGRKIKEEEYISSRDRIQKIDSFFYNQEDQLIKQIGYGYDDGEQGFVLSYNFVYTYDEKGNLKQKAMTDGSRNIGNDFVQGVVMEYSYNNENQLIESLRYDAYSGFAFWDKSKYSYY